MAYGDFVIQHDLNFTINKGDIFIIMGGSGCGKSTLLHDLVGLQAPARGRVLYSGESLWEAEARAARRDPAKDRGDLSGRRVVELDDLGRERGAPAGAVYRI